MKLREWRKENKLTRAEAAKAFGINVNTYIAIEAGTRHPTTEQAAKIEEITKKQVAASELLSHLLPPGYELRKARKPRAKKPSDHPETPEKEDAA